MSLDKKQLKEIQNKMLERLDDLIKEKNLTRAEVERLADLGNRTLRNWGDSFPAIDKFYRVSRILGVSMNYLLYGEITEIDVRTLRIKEINTIIEKLDDETLSNVYNFIKIYEERNKERINE